MNLAIWNPCKQYCRHSDTVGDWTLRCIQDHNFHSEWSCFGLKQGCEVWKFVNAAREQVKRKKRNGEIWNYCCCLVCLCQEILLGTVTGLQRKFGEFDSDLWRFWLKSELPTTATTCCECLIPQAVRKEVSSVPTQANPSKKDVDKGVRTRWKATKSSLCTKKGEKWSPIFIISIPPNWHRFCLMSKKCCKVKSPSLHGRKKEKLFEYQGVCEFSSFLRRLQQLAGCL